MSKGKKYRYLSGDYGDGWGWGDGGSLGSAYTWAPEPVKPLTPHVAETKVERLGTSGVPTIFISMEAYQDMNYILGESGRDEIGWLGSVKETEHGDYLIEKVFLFKQSVSGAHCEFDQNSVSQFYTEMLKADPANRDMLNRILFWGHAHPSSWVGPSGQDEHQMDLFSHNKYFIRGIFSRQGNCEFTFFDYERKLKFIDCPWQIQIDVAEDGERRKEIAKEIKKKVTYGGFGTWPKREKDWWKNPTTGDS